MHEVYLPNPRPDRVGNHEIKPKFKVNNHRI